MATIIIPLSGTFRPNGGMTGSALKKANLLAAAGHDVKVVTFRYRLDQEEHEQHLYHSGTILKRIEFINFYESLRLRSDHNMRVGEAVSRKDSQEEMSDKILQRQHEKLTRYFSMTGDLMFTELRQEEPIPNFLRRYYDLDLNLLRIEEFGPGHDLRRIRRYLPGNQTAMSESYISNSGVAYLTVWYRKNGSVRSVISHSESANTVNPESKSIIEIQKNWFSNIVSSSADAILMVEDPYCFDIVSSALKVSQKNILTLHSNTFKIPDNPNSGINEENEPLLNKIDSFETIVTSTSKQSAELSSLYPMNNFRSIPQVVAINNDIEPTSHDENLIIYLGRLEPSKQILEMIEAISRIFEKYDDVKLKIFGEGSLRSDIIDLICKLGLDTKIELAGPTASPLHELQKANFTLMPTKYEGFGLVIAESMLVGTPVVSFDCRYGPSDMIDDGVNGKLVEAQNFSAFEKAVVDLLDSPKLVAAMREPAAQKISSLCSVDVYVKKWNKLISD